MTTPLSSIPPLLWAAATIAGAGAMIAWRLREARAPVTLRKIVAPPLGMGTGLAMFAAPAFRVPWAWAAAALLAGALLLAVPLARTSRLVRRGEDVVLQRSPAFLWILLALAAMRLGVRGWIGHALTPAQTGGLLFLLAFGTVVRWRAGMLRAYLRLRATPAPARAPRAPPAAAGRVPEGRARPAPSLYAAPAALGAVAPESAGLTRRRAWHAK